MYMFKVKSSSSSQVFFCFLLVAEIFLHFFCSNIDRIELHHVLMMASNLLWVPSLLTFLQSQFSDEVCGCWLETVSKNILDMEKSCWRLTNTRYGSVGGALLSLSKRRFLRMANDMIPAAKNCNSEESAEPILHLGHTRCVAEEKERHWRNSCEIECCLPSVCSSGFRRASLANQDN